MSFIREFQNLLATSPRYNVKCINSENSVYADTAGNSKNCYYCFGIFYSEDVYHARYSRKCKSCSGIAFCLECEWCLECVDCVKCYMTDHCKDCSNCSECRFCNDCYGCNHCFGCVNLYHKEYYIFNIPYSKEDYEKYVGELDLNNEKNRKVVKKKLEEISKSVQLLSVHEYQTENCIGDHISQCKGCIQCFDAFYCEDCLYAIEVNSDKNCCDISVCFGTEESYSCVQCPRGYNCKFLVHSDDCSDCEFCAYSKSLKNCFGCTYLMQKEYHILNKPYSKEEYFEKVEEIKKELQSKNLYNLSLFFISDYEKDRLKTEEDPAIQVAIADDLTYLPMSDVLVCQNKGCGKKFSVIPQEKEFYERKKLPLPDFCPACRHKQRMALRNERKLYKRKCAKCGEDMLATFPEDVPYTVYCQKCFWENIG